MLGERLVGLRKKITCFLSYTQCRLQEKTIPSRRQENERNSVEYIQSTLYTCKKMSRGALKDHYFYAQQARIVVLLNDRVRDRFLIN